jgi:uncharacterized protein (TIGR02300 family)
LSKPELGVKRRCLQCTAAFFDLNKSPINCPKCGAVFQEIPLPRSPPRRAAFRQVPVASFQAEAAVDPVEAEETEEVEEADEVEADDAAAVEPAADDDLLDDGDDNHASSAH